jgi:hypothetical protein
MNKKSQETQLKKIETIINIWWLFVIIVVIIAALTSCSGTKPVYRIGDGWKQAAQKSEVTGWNRAK